MDLRQNHSVLELGAGEGFFIWMTAPNVRSLTAIEIDPQLITQLNARFKDFEGIRAIRRSMTSTVKFGDYDVIFGNIPFNRSADVLKKYLVLQSGSSFVT
jgi:16S rRNA A1518/A1519 N6-dimethyltransferase RsmA/KsgA/DIM1 with predicted DNA glycosylase/AP lyase activity